MKSVKDSLMGEGVYCPEHGIDYDIDCEKCHEVTREYVLKNGLYIAIMKMLSSTLESRHEPWNSDSFLFYMRDRKAVHDEELEKAREEGDREKELMETGYLQALDLVIGELLTQ